ncbi:MAG: glycosyltransferase family 4 protein [Actinobacteria bacterium]|nr:glycosyltransferase family 4 protein [Actinomycetota bacterium]
MNNKIAIVSMRLKFPDGVSVEAEKWAQTFRMLGHKVYYIAGEFNEIGPNCIRIQEMSFDYPEVEAIQQKIFAKDAGKRLGEMLTTIKNLKERIKTRLLYEIKKHEISYLSIENALSIPMNVPLGLALFEILKEEGLSAVARHHDFYWERDKFLNSPIEDILSTVFPPRLKNLKHVVINSIAQKTLKSRSGIEAMLIPNSFDFNKIRTANSFNSTLRKDLGVGSATKMFLQPTRIIQRKKIERSIELISMLPKYGVKDAVLLTTAGGEESEADYLEFIKRYSGKKDVRTIFANNIFQTTRAIKGYRKYYDIHDAYVHCDFVTLPSDIEGFGNPVIEACAYKKPLFVNRYPVLEDMLCHGFNFVLIDGPVTEDAVKKTVEFLEDEKFRNRITRRNYEIARDNYSFELLLEKLKSVL